MQISYNSIQLTEFVKNLSYSADVINAYIPKDSAETNIINDTINPVVEVDKNIDNIIAIDNKYFFSISEKNSGHIINATKAAGSI